MLPLCGRRCAPVRTCGHLCTTRAARRRGMRGIGQRASRLLITPCGVESRWTRQDGASPHALRCCAWQSPHTGAVRGRVHTLAQFVAESTHWRRAWQSLHTAAGRGRVPTRPPRGRVYTLPHVVAVSPPCLYLWRCPHCAPQGGAGAKRTRRVIKRGECLIKRRRGDAPAPREEVECMPRACRRAR